MSKLAESFGISDVGLSKICDRHRVPTPPRGYWAKNEAGKPVSQEYRTVTGESSFNPKCVRFDYYYSRG